MVRALGNDVEDELANKNWLLYGTGKSPESAVFRLQADKSNEIRDKEEDTK